MPITLAIIGPPGSGKTTLACLTAPAPVHVVDLDRKVRAMAAFQTNLKNGTLTYREVGETLGEDSLAQRMNALVENKKAMRPPRGWTNFANYVGDIENDVDAKAAKTIVIDSYTTAASHARAHIQFMRDRSKFAWDEWSIWKAVWTETTIILIDYALANDKNLIVIMHERVSEKPGEQTGRVMVKTGEKGDKAREYIGAMDVRIAGSIEGAFGLEFGAYFTDVYSMRVDVQRGRPPKWICRVLPDGQRDLRCSFNVGEKGDHEPNLMKIWGMVK